MQSQSSSAVLIKSDSDPLPRRHGLGDDDVDLEGDGEEEEGKETSNKISTRVSKLRRVSFPVDEHLVTGYVEPPNPWEKAIGVTELDVISSYVAACNRYNVVPLIRVIQQLQMVQRFDERAECLDLQGEKLSCSHMEALEEVFKRVRFVTINLENTYLDDESSLPLFDMIEYYDSVKVLNISRNKNIAMQGWQACCRMIKRTHCLEELIACGNPMEEENIRVLQRTLKVNPTLTTLRLDNCGISGRHLTTLMNGLKPNKVLRELHLAENRMSFMDGVQLAQLLRSNLQLRLLNLSGNLLEDQGISYVAEGLGDQNQVQILLKSNNNRRGLRSLMLRDNRMTPNSTIALSKALCENKSLEVLDLGSNNINNEGVYTLKETLMRNRTLLQLKLNDCRITCEGAVALAEYVAENTKIQELDLRNNCIRLGGLLALVQSMKVNQSVTKLELDTSSAKDPPGESEQWRQLLLQVSEYSDRNSDILEKKQEFEGADDEDELEGNEDDDEIISEPVSRLLSLWSHPPPLRPSSVTCHPPITVSSVAESPPEPGSWQAVRGSSHYHHHHYLRSPQPSPSSSPIPSPTRNRFHVTRVFQEVDSNLASTAHTQVAPVSLPVSSKTYSSYSKSTSTSLANGNRVKFIVTPVIDVHFEEPVSCSSATSSSSSSPQLDEQKCDPEELSDNDSVFLDQQEIACSASISSSTSTSSSSVTLELGNESKSEEEEQDEANCNGDRDSGIYLLDLSCEELDANSNTVTVVPNEGEHSSNSELIDRLLQDTSVTACDDIMVKLVDVGENYPWVDSQTNLSADSTVGEVDFLTESNVCNGWTSTTNVTGDLITFSETVEPVKMWLDERNAGKGDVVSISNMNTDNSGSYDGGESSGSSDSGVTESLEGDFCQVTDAATPIAIPVNEKTPLNAVEKSESGGETHIDCARQKLKNGYRSVASFQGDDVSDGKRTRTPGCAGSKDGGSFWPA